MVTITRRHMFAVALLAIVSASAFAAKIADVKNTKHNLSATPYSAGTDTRTVKATSESQICVFCHTPHKANLSAPAPLWNRTLSSATYTTYTSESMDATLAQPDGSSKLCLSCHDGTMALGSVGVLNGQQNVTIAMQSTNIDGSGADTGYTRNLGTNLSNDHPISFTYDSTLATTDGELNDPALTSYIKNRTPGATHPNVPLENDKMQCVACHDPHIRDVDTTRNAKFLRLNRFQEVASSGGAFSAADDQVCLGCHSKAGWSGSAHANSTVATQSYLDPGASQREFPVGLQVWQAGCLNCHDTHTVQGARRLLREGTDSTAVPKAGGTPALEETCYQCHDGGTNGVLNSYTTVPNIGKDYGVAPNPATKHMPIKSSEQLALTEVHAISDKDFTEDPLKLGKGNLNNRHAECTDCHNPHRVIKNRLFNANPTTADAAGTHSHDYGHTNIASGVLAGATGVEPVYGLTTWGSLPTTYTLKKGNGGSGASTAASSNHVTREYQVCLKCHSDYAWNEPNRPTTGPSIGTNGVTMYTNQAMEFQAPLADKGEKAPGSVGVNANHRSWHPVIDNTGRTAAVRKQNSGAPMDHRNFRAPWNDTTGTNVGNQTMYCSDCHGSNVTSLTDVIPDGGENGNPWGPHGSSNAFILKGSWDQQTGVAGATDTGICFKCHDWNQYANNANTVPQASGFSGTTGAAGAGCQVLQNATTNMHIGHARRLGQPLECTWCHVAVPHGWKNKQLLIDISTAGGSACAGAEPCNEAPYILQGYLGGNNTAVNWRVSGEWTSADCGGQAWMAGNGAGCNNPL